MTETQLQAKLSDIFACSIGRQEAVSESVQTHCALKLHRTHAKGLLERMEQRPTWHLEQNRQFTWREQGAVRFVVHDPLRAFHEGPTASCAQ